MRTLLLGVAAGALALTAFGAEAQPIRTRVYAPPYPAAFTPDELRDYQLDQLERRQEMEREGLRFRQRAERRSIDPDED